MSLSDKREEADNDDGSNGFLWTDDVKESMKEILQTFHKGTLYEGESIWKIIEDKLGKELTELEAHKTK